jgi:hypothetical protein
MQPLNPLNYSFKTEKQLILGQVDEEAAKAFDNFKDFFPKVTMPEEGPNAGGEAFALELSRAPEPEVHCVMDTLVKISNAVNDSLSIDQKSKINQLFQRLKNLTFADNNTIQEINAVGNEKQEICRHFEHIQGLLKKLADSIQSYHCSDKNYEFIIKRIFAGILKELIDVDNEQYKRLSNLNNVFDKVEAAAKEANRKKDELTWYNKLDEVSAPRGGTTLYSVTVNEAGYSLSDDGEIVASETKVKYKKTLRIRRYSLFIPEVSAGVAYTDLSFPKFGLRTDSASGKQFVADAGNEKNKRYNITAMMNWTAFIPYSFVHPFIQTGVGVNADFPTIFLGGGLRFNINGKGRFAIACGAAVSWIKTLGSLKIGDEVSGSADIEKDVKYELASPKAYFGIQYNF